jgi:hypothetical protein
MAHKRKHHPLYRRHHSGGATNYKALGLAAAVGVAAVVGLGFAQTKVEYLRVHWYAGPAVLAVGGALLAKRMPTIALGLVASAGVFGYIGYMANAEAEKAAAQNQPPKPAAGFYGSAGLDAGAYRGMLRQDSGLFERGNAGMLTGAGALQGRLADARTNAAGLQGVGVRSARASRGAAGSLSD